MSVHRFDHIDAIDFLFRFVAGVVLLRYAIGIYQVIYFPI